ncbi:MAG: hypothetical protein K5694_03460 [Bacilli bacterium]|nr:hypothetical protein [Bacilli bacterium]
MPSDGNFLASTPELIRFYLCLIIGLIVYFGVLVGVIYQRIKRKTSLSPFIIISLFFIGHLIILIPVYTFLYDHQQLMGNSLIQNGIQTGTIPYNNVPSYWPAFKIISGAFTSFVFQIDFDAMEYLSECGDWIIRNYFIFIAITAVADTIATSYALIRLFLRALKANGKTMFRWLVREDIYYIFTDLEFDEIKSFIIELESGKSRPGRKPPSVRVILSRSSQYTDPGRELHDQLVNARIAVFAEDLSKPLLIKFMRKHRIFYKKNEKVNFYSLYYKDEKNYEFARIACEIFEDCAKKKDTEHYNKRFNTYIKYNHFYISYQNAELFLENNNDFAKKSRGAISLFNEYTSNAEDFVFNMPLTEFILKRKGEDKDVKVKFTAFSTCNPRLKDGLGFGFLGGDVTNQNIYSLIPSVDINFFGFGRINQTLLTKMSYTYQIPGCNKETMGNIDPNDPNSYKLNFFVYSNDDNSEFVDAHFRGVSKENDAELTRNFGYFTDIFNFENEIRLQNSLERIVDRASYHNINKDGEDIDVEKQPSREVIIIATGDPHNNFALAVKTQHIIRQIIAKRKALGERFKSIPIFVHINREKIYNSSFIGDDIFEMRQISPVINRDNNFPGENGTSSEREIYLSTAVPIVIFGRDKRFRSDDSASSLKPFAVRSKYVYDYDYDLVLSKDGYSFSLKRNSKPTIDAKAENKFDIDDVRNCESNYATAAHLPTKLGLMGLCPAFVAEKENAAQRHEAIKDKLGALNNVFDLNEVDSGALTASMKELQKLVAEYLEHRKSIKADSKTTNITLAQKQKYKKIVKYLQNNTVLLEKYYEVFTLGFVNRIKPGLRILAETEHNRWLYYCLSRGDVPMSREHFFSKNIEYYSTKGTRRGNFSKDAGGTVHFNLIDFSNRKQAILDQAVVSLLTIADDSPKTIYEDMKKIFESYYFNDAKLYIFSDFFLEGTEYDLVEEDNFFEVCEEDVDYSGSTISTATKNQ